MASSIDSLIAGGPWSLALAVAATGSVAPSSEELELLQPAAAIASTAATASNLSRMLRTGRASPGVTARSTQYRPVLPGRGNGCNVGRRHDRQGGGARRRGAGARGLRAQQPRGRRVGRGARHRGQGLGG